MEHQLNMSIALEAANKRVTLKINLSNLSPDDYYIHNNALMFGGVGINRIKIFGPSAIDCAISSRHGNHGTFLLQSSNTISNDIFLNKVCNFWDSDPGNYTVEFHSVIHPCLANTTCLGSTVFNGNATAFVGDEGGNS